MSTKHTKGPWFVSNTGHIETEHAIIADPYEMHVGAAAAKANAQLIAAAPELLEIAKAYRNLLRTSAHTDGQVATFQHIESVLVKIEGEEK